MEGGDIMAGYLAMRIEAGALDYATVFSKETYKPYQADVDAILIADGRQDLIVPIT